MSVRAQERRARQAERRINQAMRRADREVGQKIAARAHEGGGRVYFRNHRVLGTHTHVTTADASILPGGTAYMTDVGMTGCEESIIGFDREIFLGLFLGERRWLPVASEGPVLFNAALLDFDVEGRRATGIEPVRRRWEP